MTYKSLISMTSRLAIISAFIVIVLPLLAAPADLDPTWGGGDGIVTLNLDGMNPNWGVAGDILELPDGKLLVLVPHGPFDNTGRDGAVLRYLQNGTLDSTFGDNGVAPLPSPANVKSLEFYHFALQPDGKIVVSGTITFLSEPRDIMSVVRLLSDGTPDTTFGTDGLAIFDVADLFNLEGLTYIGAELTVQPDGKLIVLIGYTNEQPYHILVRLNPNGSIDQSFGDDGIVLFQGTTDALYSSGGPSLQPDGKLIVTSMESVPVKPIFFRFNNDGSPDLSFGDAGKAIINPLLLEHGSSSVTDEIFAGQAWLLPNGKIGIFGFFAREDHPDRRIFVGRLENDGTLDNTVDDNGVAIIDLADSDELPSYVSLQANGKYLMTGTISASSGSPFVARFNTDDTLDTTWQGIGYRLLDLEPGYIGAERIISQRDGKVVVGIVGFDIADVIIARLEGDPAFGYTSVTPAHLTTGVPVHANLTLNFVDPITVNTGKIEIRRVGGFSLFESISVNDATRVYGSGTNTITINPTVNFEPNTQYFVVVDPNTFMNTAGHPFSGVRELIDWHFTTGEAGINTAPVMAEVADKSIEAEQLLTFTATATDIDGNNLTFSLDDGDMGSVPTGAAITAGGEFSWTPSEAQEGQHTFDVVVTDDGEPNLSDSETITVTVTEPPFVNSAPTLTAIGSQTVEAGQTLGFVASATDPDTAIGQVLTFSLDDGDTGSVPAGAAITAGGAFSWTPNEAQEGQHTFDVVVTDDGEPNLSDSETITVTVTEPPFVNSAPTLTAIGSQTVEAGQTLEFAASATDPDTAIGQVLTFSLDDGDTGSVPAGAAITADGEFSWTPSEAQVGQHTFDVVVTDDGEPNLSDSETITVTVTAAPVEPPTELLLNRGFENKTPNNPKRAAKWTVSKLVSADGRVCNQPNKTPSVTVAYDGKCAFEFNYSVAKPRYIEQKMTLTEALEGHTMRVAGYIKRKGLTTGAAIQVQITYADTSKATLKIAIPSGTKGYKPFENTLLLEQGAIKARVRITTGKSKGRLLVDDLSLTVSDGAPLTISDTPILVPDLRGN